MRLKAALACYALLALLAAATLVGAPRLIVLLLLALFAVKSWLAARREELENR
jgi:hypothetical protein